VTDICLAGGLQNDQVYQLIYRATKSPIMGLGYVTTRDWVSFLRHQEGDDPAAPTLAGRIDNAICKGESQSGLYLRDYIYQGFNEDEQGRRVCDGVMIQVSGVEKLFLNYRFAQPNPFTVQHRERYLPGDTFPRSYGVREDPNSSAVDGILKRPDTDPKVMHIDSAREHWQFRSSLVDTDEAGTVDIEQPPNVRRYLFSSSPHGATKGAQPNHGIADRQCQQVSNVTHYGAVARALDVALDDWIRGIEVPESSVPRIDDGTLINPDQYCKQFPSIPGVTCNGLYNASGDRDFGPHVLENRGVIDFDYLIPHVRSTHQVLVPAVDRIGNDLAGIRHPFVEAPIATLTGWSLRTAEFGPEGDLCDLPGQTIPLLRTQQQREEAGDPRPSLEELYGDHRGYVTAVAQAAVNLYARRLLLLEDVERIIQEADDSPVLR